MAMIPGNQYNLLGETVIIQRIKTEIDCFNRKQQYVYYVLKSQVGTKEIKTMKISATQFEKFISESPVSC
jgi:hypothetical protein